MSGFSRIEQKLQMADYLLSRSPSFPAAAMKHIVEVANELITIHLNLGNNFVGPILASKKLAEMEETKFFAVSYGRFWKLPLSETVTHSDAVNAYKATKSFLGQVKRAHGPA